MKKQSKPTESKPVRSAMEMALKDIKKDRNNIVPISQVKNSTKFQTYNQ